MLKGIGGLAFEGSSHRTFVLSGNVLWRSDLLDVCAVQRVSVAI